MAKIVFNGMHTGFGNNGGTQTNFRTANGLAELGYNVEVWSSGANQFTWFKLHPDIKYKIHKTPPKDYIDVVFMCGFKTYNTTKEIISDVKINWIRGWETWSNSESKLIAICKDEDIIQWTNSLWIYEHLKEKNIESTIVYPGLPVDDFYKEDVKRFDEFTIGMLNNTVHSSPDKGFKISSGIAKKLKKENIKVVGYGNTPSVSVYDKYYQRPNNKQKRQIYNMCDLWLVTSTNEGLHIPPMEAGLCGTPSLVPETRRCGLYDWFLPREDLTYKSSDITDALSCILKYSDNIHYNKNTKASIVSRIGSIDSNIRCIDKLIKELLTV